MDISYQYMKKRCDFGRQLMFCEQGPEMCDSIATNVAEHKNFILRNPVHQPTQNTSSFSEKHINTFRAEYTNSGANHAEGGWPKDVVVTDPEATQRYRRKVEKEDDYINCVMTLSTAMEHYVLQNNAIEMYHTYYAEMASLPAIEYSTCRNVNEYRDVHQRPVSSICWQPEGGHRFAVTYVEIDFFRVPRGPVSANVWDVENSNAPEIVLQPPCPMLDLQYSPRDGNLLVGALANGQLTAFDRREGGVAIGTSSPHSAHRDVARKVLFINTKSGQEFFSSGPDGACKWWDLRNFEEPTDEMIMDYAKSSFDVPSMANANGVSVIEYEPTIPTRFMVGTENGLVISGNRKGKTPMEKLPVCIATHLGPVWSLERNPGFLKNFLTVGDWTARVWSEDCRESAVLWTPSHRHRVTAGTWSPTRFSLMELAGADGQLSLWDLIRRQHEPVLTMQVCEEPLLQLRAHEAGSLIALGSRKGSIYMVELSQNLTISDKNDKVFLSSILERESKREKILEARLREIKLKLRQAEEGSITGIEDHEDPSVGDKDFNEATTEYMLQVKKEIASMS